MILTVQIAGGGGVVELLIVGGPEVETDLTMTIVDR